MKLFRDSFACTETTGRLLACAAIAVGTSALLIWQFGDATIAQAQPAIEEVEVPGRNTPLGSIVASPLSWEDYAKANAISLPFDIKDSKWAPCDGRSIDGSRLDRRTGGVIKTAPDLRGTFIRGMNVFAADELNYGKSVSEAQADQTQGGRRAGLFEPSRVGAHKHLMRVIKEHHDAGEPTEVGVERPDNGFGAFNNFEIIDSSPRDLAGENPTGETAPGNVALYYYIRIN